MRVLMNDVTYDNKHKIDKKKDGNYLKIGLNLQKLEDDLKRLGETDVEQKNDIGYLK